MLDRVISTTDVVLDRARSAAQALRTRIVPDPPDLDPSGSAARSAARGLDELTKLESALALSRIGRTIRECSPEGRMLTLGFSIQGRNRRFEAVLLDAQGDALLDLGQMWRDGGPGAEDARYIADALDPWSVLPIFRDRSAGLEKPRQIDQWVVTYDVSDLAAQGVDERVAQDIRSDALAHFETAAMYLEAQLNEKGS